MKLPVLRRPALVCAAVAACLVACEPVDNPDAVARPYKAPPPHPRRAEHPNTENVLWLTAWRDLRARLEPMEEKLAEVQKMHAEHNFDSFLALDPETMDKDQLCSLFHFLQRGFFTVERRVLLHLLERRMDRTDSLLTIPAHEKRPLKDHLAAAMHRDEIRMVDLETAIQFYAQPGGDQFQIPDQLSEDELIELRSAVTKMLDKADAEIAELDEKIEELKARAFGTTTEAASPAEDEAMTNDETEPAPEAQ